MIEIALIVAAFVVAYALIAWYPDTTERWFARFMAGRQVVLGTVAVIIALVFLGSGYPPLMAIGFLTFVYIALYVLFEDPHREVLGWR